MNINQFVKITDKIDEIDTFESYTSGFYLVENNFLMPFVNLLFIENVIGNKPSERIEFSYILLKNVTQIDWIGQDNLGKKITGRKNISNTKSIFTDWFTYNTENKESYELKVNFDEMWLCIPNKARIAKMWFAPFDTPNFSKNVSENNLDDFQNLGMLKESDKFFRQIKIKFVFYNSNKIECKDINDNWTKT